MKTIKQILTIFLFTSICSVSFAQDELLSKLPTTEVEFKNSEKNVLATINWLQISPVEQDVEKRKIQNAYLIAWVSNSPTVTLELNANILTFTKKNSELLILFMAGWTKYALENNYSKDTFNGTLAGVKSVLNFYKKNPSLKKDKEVQKLIDLETKGELEKWVKEQNVVNK